MSTPNMLLQPLGTPESALEACVSLLSAVTGQREDYMAGWLDLYYQVRCGYERERLDAAPVLLEKGSLEAASAALFTSSAAAAAPSPQGEGRNAPGEEGAPPPPRESGLSGFEPVEAVKKPSPWVLYKRRVSGRLAEARLNGITVGQIVKASCGILTEAVVLNAINAGHLSRAEWHALDRALAIIPTHPNAARVEEQK